jgi:hypothetical protein
MELIGVVAPRRAVLVVLILTVVFVMFMASVPLWFSGLIRSLAP